MRKITKIIVVAAIVIVAMVAVTVYMSHDKKDEKKESEELGVMEVLEPKEDISDENTTGADMDDSEVHDMHENLNGEETEKSPTYYWEETFSRALAAVGQPYDSTLSLLSTCVSGLPAQGDFTDVNALYNTVEHIDLKEGIIGDIIFFIADDSTISDIGIMAGHNNVFIVSDGTVVKELASLHGKNMEFGRMFRADNTVADADGRNYFELSAAESGYISPEVLVSENVDASSFDNNLEDLGICVSDYMSELELKERATQIVVESVDTERFDQFAFITIYADNDMNPYEVRYWYENKVFDIVY